MNKYYSYSVKEELTKYFPGDTITQMRMSDADGIKKERANLISKAWAYADDMAIMCFQKGKFLVDTVLHDDYIAYFIKTKDADEVFLSFMHFENEGLHLDPEYAYNLIAEWENKGYKAYIMRNCVAVSNYPNSDDFRFVSHSIEDGGSDYLIPVLVDGKYIFVGKTESFWEHATALLYSAIVNGSDTEYESILTDDAVIAYCKNRSEYEIANNKFENVEPFVNGIGEIKAYFNSKSKIYVAYVKRHKNIAYSQYIIADGNKYTPFVGVKNQLVQLVEEPITSDEEVILVPKEQMPKVIAMPGLDGVRSLDVSTMHAYGIQLSYNDGCVKNYYIAAITTKELPESVSVNGYEFDQEMLDSAKIICNAQQDGVIFDNGYYVPKHILYYRGRTQLIPEKTTGTVFENDSIKIESKFRLPFHIRRGGLYETYQPRPDAYYGTGDTIIDEDGNRKTDYSGSYMDSRGMGEEELIATYSESSDLAGYLKANGEWMFPPVLDSGDDFEDNHCVQVKKDNKKYLLNELGELIDFPYDVRLDYFSQGLCEFSTGRCESEYEFPDEDSFEELSAGNWGFIDKYGKITIEPQYVFTSGYCWYDNRAFVAKIVDGKTLWGLIDEKGNEIIPCIYSELSTHSGTAVNFRKNQFGDWGIMDFDGNVIMEPRYSGIYEYDEKHGLIAYFTDWDEGHQVGVARVDNGEVIVPNKYCYIGFEEDYIECENEVCDENGNMYDYYDYNGNKLFVEHDCCRWKCDGGYASWNKEHKCGAMDKDNNIIAPYVFDKHSYVDYYLQGFVVTGTKGKHGLSTREGKLILPERYSDITINDDFIIASYNNNHNWDIISELYTMDGTPVFSDICRRAHIYKDKITRETPFGIEHFTIIKK